VLIALAALAACFVPWALLRLDRAAAAARAHGSGLLQFSAQINNSLAWGKDTIRPMCLGLTHDCGPFFTHLRLQCSALIPVIPPAGSPHFEEGALPPDCRSVVAEHWVMDP
jgi:hypothetical protein